MEINILDRSTIDKIAAGEVVERPLNVVKELMENAIDSGADAISVEIKNGGKSLIRVTDNGCGISADQIEKAFKRHATSKIKSADDLSFVTTLGFRGEALSSIAAVSEVELCSKTSDALTGAIIHINGGTKESVTEAGLPCGTTVIVRDLFLNVPVRLKFLASDQTESNAISSIVEKIALSHPDISIKYKNNGSIRLSTSGNGSLKDVIFNIYGREIASNLINVNFRHDLLEISGYIGKPEIQRANRQYEVFFVNGRYVKNNILQAALENAFKGYQMKGSYPFCALNIHIEPELMDVNIHPSKREIRFFNNEAVYEELYNSLYKLIKERENIPSFNLDSQDEIKNPVEAEWKDIAYAAIPEPFEASRRCSEPLYSSNAVCQEEHTDTIDNEDLTYGPGDTYVHEKENIYKSSDDHFENTDKSKYVQQTIFEEHFLGEKAKKSHKIIGEIFSTYWIVEYNDKMYIIDQHAAHEKVLYERFLGKLKTSSHLSQSISPGIILTLSAAETDCLLKYFNEFTRLGFVSEPFGKTEYIITAVPVDLYGLDEKTLFINLLDELNESPVKVDADMLTDRIATAACKAAVKGEHDLSFEEADRLIDELLSLENPYNCPHGRPTIITMSKYEMEKKFKRII